jgi:ribosomal protein S18 acetylase RimI-like enzyme
VEIRRLAEGDAGTLWNLRLTALESEPQAFAETADHHRNTPVEAYAGRLRSGGPDNPVFGAFDGARIAGMIGLYREQTEARRTVRIWGMFVLPEYRRLGVARALVQAIVAHARTLPALDAVHLEVAGTQDAARNLYLSCGFRSIGAGAHGGEEMMLPLV